MTSNLEMVVPTLNPQAAYLAAGFCVAVQVGLWFAKKLILDTYFARKAKRAP